MGESDCAAFRTTGYPAWLNIAWGDSERKNEKEKGTAYICDPLHHEFACPFFLSIVVKRIAGWHTRLQAEP